MMKYLFLLFFSLSAFAKEPLRVVVLDSGLNLNDQRFQGLLCKEGHRDFTGLGMADSEGHGTHVTGLIKDYAGNSSYCLVIVKYYDRRAQQNMLSYKHAISYVNTLKFDVVNISGGGTFRLENEIDLILTHPRARFLVAIGNDNKDLDQDCKYYPACYAKEYVNLKQLVTVGSKCNTFKSDFSNYGSFVSQWECGESIESSVPGGTRTMSGTSMATAIASGKLIYQLTHDQK